MNLFSRDIFADYFQFYISDSSINTDFPTDWTDEALRRRVLAADGILMVATARNATVPVRVELHDGDPNLATEAADHVVIGNLQTSGEMVIAGLTDYLPDAVRVPVPAGNLRVLVVFTGLGTISEDGLEGEDRYVVHLWPGESDDAAVLRQWNGG